jgi:TPR repeat protein
MYYHGRGAAQNHEEAVTWYRLAADQGHGQAQFNLGNRYYLAQNHEEAVKWYRLAAAQGDADAQFNLGASFANGHGVGRDLVQAEHWLQLAADQGKANAKQALLQVAAARAASTTTTTATPPSISGTWPAGTQVVVQGLVKAAQLNGRAGTIVRWVADKGRYQVDLGGRPNSIKPGNLKLG